MPKEDTAAEPATQAYEYVVESADDAEVFSDRDDALQCAVELINDYRAEATSDGEWSPHVEDIMVYERRVIGWASAVPDGDSSVDYELARAAEGSP